MLRRVLASDGAIHKCAREGFRVGDIEEVGHVERRVGKAVNHSDYPPLFRETAVPRTNVALSIGMHVDETGVPEEPYIFLVGDRFGLQEILVDFGVGTQVELGGRNGVAS